MHRTFYTKGLFRIIICICLSLVMPMKVYPSDSANAVSRAENDETKELPAFDKSVYEGLYNYSYNQFEGTWQYYASFGKQYSDAYLVFGMNVWGNDQGLTSPPDIYVWLKDADNKEVLYDITGIKMLVGEEEFSVDSMIIYESQSVAYLDSIKGQELLEAMLQVKEMSIGLVYDGGSTIIDILETDYGPFKLFAKMLLQNYAWDYIVDENGTLEEWNQYIAKNCPLE